MRAGRKVRLWGLRVRDAGRLPCEARAPALLFPLALNRVTIRNGHLLLLADSCLSRCLSAEPGAQWSACSLPPMG